MYEYNAHMPCANVVVHDIVFSDKKISIAPYCWNTTDVKIFWFREQNIIIYIGKRVRTVKEKLTDIFPFSN